MLRYQRRAWLFATALSFLAGYVDALGFLALGGFFVSFMSGNSTRLGVGLRFGLDEALIAGGLIVSFVMGVMVATALTRRWPHRRPTVALAAVALLLVVAALAHVAGSLAVSAAFIAAAMGAENTVFERDGEVSVGVTYMTGTLVKLGQHLVAALRGNAPLGWIPYLLLWVGLIAGAVAGSTVHPWWGLNGLWPASVFAVALALLAWRVNV